ncbi:maleylacetate reductase [Actinomycetospora endophytica]|uniref:Maleylacetate reductase n=1 Tax=Actinomycetospora endophytica TaxID=2291215 RepID=A0ABS8P9C1_9PSEU|nr:maleylacetate reductase [Actinomycetospora endophytica]MCD2194527.1 maleylacetate reductase [Actinomycetospora endophytica]
MRFTELPRPSQVVFGAGRFAEVGDEVARLGCRRVVVVTTPGRKALGEEAAGHLGDRSAGVLAEAVEHVPGEIADAGVARARELDADGCVAVGGGSAIGLGKAIVRDTGLPLVAVPTTYSGSEMTPVWGRTEDGVKTTGRDERARPAVVVYDPELTTSLPVAVSVTSAVNALAHAVEALWAPDGTPVTRLESAESARAIVDALPRVASSPADPDARGDLLYGAWLAGSGLAATTMGLHHRLAHVLGGGLDLPHAGTHTVLLPAVMAYTLPAAPVAAVALENALGGDPVAILSDLLARLGAPTTLAELGADDAQFDVLAERAVTPPPTHPRVPTAAEVRSLIGGLRPREH